VIPTLHIHLLGECRLISGDIPVTCNGYLGHPFKNLHIENKNDLPPMIANKDRWV
jgi:hypothetical protein